MVFEESESGETPEPEPTERPIPAKSTVKARLLKPKPLGTVTGGQEIEDAVSELSERLEKLEAQKAPGWREVGEKQTKPVGTNFDSELLDRMNKTIVDYEKSGVKLYKRKMLEEGLEEQLDVLNSTAEIDDAFEKACAVGWGEEPPSVKKFVEHIEGIEDWVWTSERAKYALNLLKGRPEKIEEFLNAEPQVRQLVDFATIERLKKAAKGKLPKGAEGEDISDGLFGLFDEGEEEESGEEKEEGGEEEEPFP